jgi:hypothetical protein
LIETETLPEAFVGLMAANFVDRPAPRHRNQPSQELAVVFVKRRGALPNFGHDLMGS